MLAEAAASEGRHGLRIPWSSSIRYSGLLGIAVLVLIFTLWLPGLFFTQVTLRTIIANQAVTGFLALGALIPLCAGLIDLSFGAVAGLSLTVTVWLNINTGMSMWIDAIIAIACSVLCGLVSGVLIAVFRLDSFIVTLGMSSLTLGIAELITANESLYGRFPSGFTTMGQGKIGPIPYLTIALVVLAIILWIWLEHTPGGRFTLAVGSNPVAARLAGISVTGTYLGSMLASALVAGIAGVMLAAQAGNAASTIGPGYLLPAIAALFLGATQVRDRVNVVGTIIAVFLLGTGVKGLQLAGAQTWVTDVFNGGVLILAIFAAAMRGRRATTGTSRTAK